MRVFIPILAVIIVVVAVMTLSSDPESPEVPTQEPTTNNTEEDVENPNATLEGDTETGPGRTHVVNIPENQEAVSATVDPASAKNGIVGVVTSLDGLALEGVQVTLSVYGPHDLFAPAPESMEASQETKTDKDGRFSFGQVHPDKQYTVIAGHDDHGRRIETGVRAQVGELTELSIALEPGAELHGVVTTVDGSALSGVQLTLSFQALAGENIVGLMEQTSGPNGEFSFPHLVASNYRLEAVLEGFGNASFENIPVSGTDRVERNLQLEPAYLIEGIVESTDGLPIEGAKVTATSRAQGSSARTRSNATTDADGRFVFQDISRGIYTIIATPVGYRPGRASSISTGDLSVVVSCEPEPTITGRVLSPEGAPLKEFTVQLRMRQRAATETIPVPRKRFKVKDSEDGSYVMSCPRPGDYQIEAIHPDYAPSFSADVTVASAGLTENVDVTMTAGGKIMGRLVGPEGPVGGARVKSYHTDFIPGDPFFAGMKFPGQATELAITANADGTFVLAGLTPATYQIYVEHKDHSALSHKQIEVLEGAEVNLGDVMLEKGARIIGVVRDEAGQPVSGAGVSLMFDTAASGTDKFANYSARTNAQGEYIFSHVPAGPYKMFALRQAGGDVLSGPEDSQKTMTSITAVSGQETVQNFQF